MGSLSKRNCGLPAVADSPTVSQSAMLLPVFKDLVKRPWRIALEELKRSGGMSVSELARKTGSSYMAVKTHCEALTRAGYLLRTRLPRAGIGRPEIFYNLALKADALFPQVGVDFTLELLDSIRLMFGESAPDKLLFQHFQKQLASMGPHHANDSSTADKAVKLAAHREKLGGTSRCECDPGQPVRIVELHNPLQRVFEHYPRAVAMELRMFEQWFGSRVVRQEHPGVREAPPTVVFEIP
jgi:predicted ArsR family transcriptional regulator